MTPDYTLTIIGAALVLIIKIVVALITPSLVVGLIIAIIQAVTQVNEQTLSFLPKLIVILATVALAGTWVMREVMEFFHLVFEQVSAITQ